MSERFEIAFLIVCAVIVFFYNTRGDALHRENAAQIDDPATATWHAANGCTGALMWVGFAALLVALIRMIEGAP